MATTRWNSCYKLTSEEVTREVAGTRIGAYALGKHEGGTFYVSYVGRSDDDLRARLLQHVADGEYPHFKFGYCTTKKAAFEKECTLYHDFGGSAKLANKVHPRRPDGTSPSCPVPGCRELP